MLSEILSSPTTLLVIGLLLLVLALLLLLTVRSLKSSDDEISPEVINALKKINQPDDSNTSKEYKADQIIRTIELKLGNNSLAQNINDEISGKAINGDNNTNMALVTQIVPRLESVDIPVLLNREFENGDGGENAPATTPQEFEDVVVTSTKNKTDVKNDEKVVGTIDEFEEVLRSNVNGSNIKVKLPQISKVSSSITIDDTILMPHSEDYTPDDELREFETENKQNSIPDNPENNKNALINSAENSQIQNIINSAVKHLTQAKYFVSDTNFSTTIPAVISSAPKIAIDSNIGNDDLTDITEHKFDNSSVQIINHEDKNINANITNSDEDIRIKKTLALSVIPENVNEINNIADVKTAPDFTITADDNLENKVKLQLQQPNNDEVFVGASLEKDTEDQPASTKKEGIFQAIYRTFAKPTVEPNVEVFPPPTEVTTVDNINNEVEDKGKDTPEITIKVDDNFENFVQLESLQPKKDELFDGEKVEPKLEENTSPPKNNILTTIYRTFVKPTAEANVEAFPPITEVNTVASINHPVEEKVKPEIIIKIDDNFENFVQLESLQPKKDELFDGEKVEPKLEENTSPPKNNILTTIYRTFVKPTTEPDVANIAHNNLEEFQPVEEVHNITLSSTPEIGGEKINLQNVEKNEPAIKIKIEEKFNNDVSANAIGSNSEDVFSEDNINKILEKNSAHKKESIFKSIYQTFVKPTIEPITEKFSPEEEIQNFEVNELKNKEVIENLEIQAKDLANEISVIDKPKPSQVKAYLVEVSAPPIEEFVQEQKINVDIPAIVTPPAIANAPSLDSAASASIVYAQAKIVEEVAQEQIQAEQISPKGLLRKLSDKFNEITKIAPRDYEGEIKYYEKASDPVVVFEKFEKNTILAPVQNNEKLISSNLDEILSPKSNLANNEKLFAQGSPSFFAPAFTQTKTPVAQTINKIEDEILKSLTVVAGKSGNHLPKIESGFLTDIDSMFNSDSLNILQSALENGNFELARKQLNEVVEVQNRLFIEWRRKFGKFSRLFSLIALLDNIDNATHSLKKSTELDPSESWNWFALALFYLHKEQYKDYILSLEKALAMSVGGKISDLARESIESLPKNNVNDTKIYILSILELASSEIQSKDWDNALLFLTKLINYFQVAKIDARDEFYAGHHISALTQRAAIYKSKNDLQKCLADLLAALNLPSCQGSTRLQIIIKAILIIDNCQVSPETITQVFEEGGLLIARFPQKDIGGAHIYIALANYNFNHKKFDKAVDFYNQALAIFVNNQLIEGQIRALNGVARCQIAMSNDQKADEIYKQANLLIEKCPNIDKPTLAEITMAMGELCERNSRSREALTYFQKAAKIYRELPANAETANNISKFAKNQYLQKNFAASAELYSTSQLMFEQLGDELAIRSIYFAQAQNYLLLTNFDSAEKFVQRCLQLSQKYPNVEITAKCQLITANIAWHTNNINSACEKALVAWELQQNSENSEVIINTAELLGKIYIRMGNWALAEFYLKKSLAFARKIANPYMEVNQLLLLATALCEGEDNPQSLSLLENAEQIAIRGGFNQLFEIRLQIAYILIKHNLTDQANNVLQKLLIEETTENNQYHIYKIHAIVAKLFNKLENPTKAFESFKYAANGFKSLGRHFDEALQYLAMAEFVYKTGDFPKFFDLVNYCDSQFLRYGAYTQLAETKIWLGKAKIKLGQNENAVAHFTSAIEYFNKVSAELRAGEAQVNLGVLYMRIGKNELARSNWQNAKATFQKHHKNDLVIRVNNWLDMFNEESFV